MRSFDEFRTAVLDDVRATVKDASGTPPMHFLVETPQGDLEQVDRSGVTKSKSGTHLRR